MTDRSTAYEPRLLACVVGRVQRHAPPAALPAVQSVDTKAKLPRTAVICCMNTLLRGCAVCHQPKQWLKPNAYSQCFTCASKSATAAAIAARSSGLMPCAAAASEAGMGGGV
jgi:hypothetical protein